MIDIVFAVLIVIAIVKGYQKGLIIALFSIIAFIVGIAAAVKLSAAVAVYLQDNLSVSAKWLPIISFAVVFILVVLLIRLGANLIQKTVELALLGWVNRLGGILLYIAIYLIVYSVITFYAEQLRLIQSQTIQKSATYAFIQPWGPRVINGFASIIPVFKDMFADLQSFFGGVAGKISK